MATPTEHVLQDFKMKKRDIIQLVKEAIKETTFYGNRHQRSSISGLPGVMEEENFDFEDEQLVNKYYDDYDDLSTEEKEEVIYAAGGDGQAEEANHDFKYFLKTYKQPFIDAIDKMYRGEIPVRYSERDLNEAHPLSKVIGGRPYSYIGGPTKGQYVLSGPMNDREKETIIRGAKQAGYIAKPNMGGGVTIFLKPPAVMDEAPMFRTNVKMDPLPIRPERLKKVFDAVNNSSKPEFWKNFFESRYEVPFPENLKNITKKQAIKMNMFMNDLRNNIKEITGKLYTVKSTDGTEKQVPFANDAEAKAAVKYSNIKSVVPMEELDLTNDIGKDDYVDDEGRYAKSQLYKMAKYAVKLHQKLDDMEQLPAWLQSKITKASDYMSMVYHYLDYEMARRDGNLMQEMDRYKEEMLKELTEEPNEGNAFAVARLKAIKKLEDKKEKGEKINPEDKKFTAPDGEKKPLTNVSDDDIKAAKEL